MGIRYLTQHLLPYAQTVWLRNSQNHDQNTKNITCVVVDGPALVYHVYDRLLSWSDVQLNVVDAQPSVNEVSIGVMQFLFCLKGLGVRIEKIYFDGALPLAKRPVRLERMEDTRQKLQKLCRDTAGGFKTLSIRRQPMDIRPDKIFSRRPLYARFKTLPETAFMIPTVIEDLKYRWGLEEVLRFTVSVPELQGLITTSGENNVNHEGGSIFARMTEVVPGEADVYCAIAARDWCYAVLTSDSDLLVHDLGPEGSVIFFSSIESCDSLPNEKSLGEEPNITSTISIRATQLCPMTVAKKLGVASIQRLAYELKRHSRTSFSTIIQRAKSDTGVVEKSTSYISFMKEYDLVSNGTTAAYARISYFKGVTDPKLSELYAQYELPSFTVPQEGAYVYLPILIERHDRRAVWMQGSELRLIAYSLLNLKYPVGQKGRRKDVVIEHMRKGQRIAPIKLTLLSQKEVEQRLEAFLTQVNALVSSIRNNEGVDDVGGARDQAAFWRSFALYDILAHMEGEERPSVGKLRRFLEHGYCGEKLEWDDIHLHAQMQAVLYSLRLLKEVLVGHEWPRESLFGDKFAESIYEATKLLRDLPWMRDTAQRRYGIGGDGNGGNWRRVLEGLFSLLNEGEGKGEEGREREREREREEREGDSIEGLGQFSISSRSRSGHGQVNSSMAEAREAWVLASTLPSGRKRKKRRAGSAGTDETTRTTSRRKGTGSKQEQKMNMYDILRQVD
ncbi:hypothetical protein AJ78_05260 [Emergomyces pasteurianus Ep9510]|uniref:Asteroid domain-containing protein n=1 Tax=Emergomyces pasteurianus Ep9510 TaxID=1447872 RepID=A0A1J9PCY4_9EURO|nr:hypothetical protein AJ78_05260 [Emergomyces pasteurianus Ep9510]